MTDVSGHDRAKSRNVRALQALWPFVRHYRGMVAVASVALVLTAVVSLMLPIAVRRVVDGFETSAANLLDDYFTAALGLALLLALGTGLRYYLVTWLGERVVADIRIAVFDRM
ncbi:MAG: ABC transporter, partial [Boseongicola sp. SB0664_bin_43]|nr:ABC transporter [Boseongicola sp. SB0664_bin_43]